MPKDETLLEQLEQIIKQLTCSLAAHEVEPALGGAACLQIAARVAVRAGLSRETFLQSAADAYAGAQQVPAALEVPQ